MDRITDDMRAARDKIADDFTLLRASTRDWYRVPGGWASQQSLHANTLNALVRHGLIQKRTIILYEITETGRYVNKWGHFPKEQKAPVEIIEAGAGDEGAVSPIGSQEKGEIE